MSGSYKGVVLWEGESRFNGDPIVAIATGLGAGSLNAKTGAMVQTWVLRRDMPPGEALRTGADAAICGGCIHRAIDGLSTCYVNVGFAPARIWKGYREGIYERVTPKDRERIRSRHLRIGSYGDPAAAPAKTWRAILPDNPRHATGYTHAWRYDRTQPYRGFLMASVESKAEAEEARDKRWRSFLVVPRSRPIPEGFRWCPSDELNPGNKISCQACGACNGTRGNQRGDIAIYAHGHAAKSFTVQRERKSLVQIRGRKHLEYDGLVRMDRDLHAELKQHCRGRKAKMKDWVAKAVRAQIGRESTRRRR